MMTRTWEPRKKGYQAQRLEEHTYRDGSLHYSFVSSVGHSVDVTVDEANEIICLWDMVETTDKMRKAGWIR